ncbi:MAG: translocation/assembly module TamB domain-containing protein [Bacteroidota bacterium]
MILYLILQSPTIQTKVTHHIAENVSEEIGAEVSINRVDIHFFKTIALEEVLIKDEKGDTLVYVEELKGNVSKVAIDKNKFGLNKLVLEGAYVFLHKDRQGQTNIAFLEEWLKNDNPDRQPIDLEIDEIELYNAQFVYLDDTREIKEKHLINFKDVEAQKIDLLAREFKLLDNEFDVVIDDLSLKEKSGFLIDHFESQFSLKEQALIFKHTLLETPTSIMQFDYEMGFEEGIDFKDFDNRVYQKINLVENEIDLKDLNYFSSVFNFFIAQISVKGYIEGTVDDFSFQNLNLTGGRQTSIEATGAITNLLDKENVRIQADIRKLRTEILDVEQLVFNPLSRQGNRITLPENIKKLGMINANGQFIGTPKVFRTNGFVNSNMGAINGNVEFKNVGGSKGIEYKGYVETENFEVGQVLEITDMGKVSFQGEINGSGLTYKDLRSELFAEIQSIHYRDYNYQNIKVNGELAQRKFSGDFSINEKQIALNFSGNLDFTTNRPLLDFEADIENLDLTVLNISNLDNKANLSGRFSSNLIGLGLDESIGSLNYDNIHFENSEVRAAIGSGELQISEIDSLRLISLQSDLADANLVGSFKLKELDDVAFSILTHHLPSVYSKRDTTIDQETFLNFELRVNDLDPLFSLFAPEIKISQGTGFSGEFNSINNKFDFVLRSDSIGFGNIEFIDFFAEGVQNYYQGYFTGEIKQLELSDRFSMNDVWLTNAAYRDTLETDITWTNDEFESNGAFSLLTRIQDWEEQWISIMPSEIVMGKDYWHIDQETKIIRDSSYVFIDNLFLKDKEEFIALNGAISENANDSLVVNINEFDLKKLNAFLKDFLFELDGELNSSLTLRDAYGDFRAEVDGEISKLSLSGEEIGDLNLKSTWDKLEKKLELEGFLLANELKEIIVSGSYFPLKEEALDLSLEFNHFDLGHLNTIPSKKISDISGNANGAVQVKGDFSKPLLNGELELEQAGVRINYLNTKYTIGDKSRSSRNKNLSNKVIVENDYFGFDLMPITDQKADTGLITASIYHENFREWNFDVYSEFNDFLLLDTDREQNSLYYGTAYGTGSLNIDGYEKNINIYIDAKSDSSTVLNIPIGENGGATLENFVTFVNVDSTLSNENQTVDLSGVNLDMNLEITDDALVNLIFDEKIGDVMSGVGEGNVNIGIAPGNDLSIVGRYTVKEGDYLFTLRNTINKRFKVKPGGTITWYGDPYDAELNLEALYETRTSIYDLVLEDPENWKRRVPVECEMALTNSLLNPSIGFNIRFPGLTSSVRSTVESRINTEAEQNKQIFGLLVLNKFFPPQDGLYTSSASGVSGLGVGAESNTFELLSNQLSNWLSQISNDFDIGLNYRPGDAITNEELAVALSTQLFKDKVSIYGNFGFYNEVGLGQRSTNFIGDFILEYTMGEEGKWKLNVFNKTNDFTDTNQSPTTQGVGLLYQIEFD